MTGKAALCLALLHGDVVSIRTGFLNFGMTNVPREIGRQIERVKDYGFGVKVSRVRRDGTSRNGQDCWWMEYRLNKTSDNQPGIKKMVTYARKEILRIIPKTERQRIKQDEMLNFLNTL